VRPIYRMVTLRYYPDVAFYIFFFSTNIRTEYFKHAAHSPVVSSKCRLFYNATFFWFLYYSHFTYRVCQNLNVKLRCQKVKIASAISFFGRENWTELVEPPGYVRFGWYRVGRDGSATGWTVRGSSPVGSEIFRTRQTRSVAHLASYRMGTRSFPEIKRLGLGVDRPPHLALRWK
jgi:hypothetical protein